MSHFTNRQVILLCVLSTCLGAVLSPPVRSVAQPPEASSTSQTQMQLAQTPQPLATPPASSDSASSPSTRSATTQAIGTITGQGSTGNIAKFTGANSIGNSVLYETGGKVGIGTTAPSGVFSVNNGKTGVYGIYSASTGNGVGGTSSGAIGVYGLHTASTGTQAGVLGETHSAADKAIGIAGVILSTKPGSGSAGVRGINNGTGYAGYGVYGSQAGDGVGVYGTSVSGTGVLGKTEGATAIQGVSTSGTGVQGLSTSGIGVYGNSDDNYGTYGYSLNKEVIYGQSYNGTGVYGSSVKGKAAYFEGNVTITGTLSKGAGSFKIDHPLHPSTEYLSHSFVESPDMMNIYNGNVTNNQGEAWVHMPDYFSALNREFRYQLTPMGQFAQAIVGQEIHNNRFLIKTDKPGVKVSWQVTGVRHDAYARQHRIRVEETKTGADRGKYLYPAGFGFGKDKQIGHNPPRFAKR